MTKIYIESINEKDIIKLLNDPKKIKIWHIHKEIIDICMDCEYRHMCVDDRKPIKGVNNKWYHKTNCPYNPYIAKWEHEDGYISVEEWRKQNPGWEEKRT